ncbi:hypothetical protein D9A36_16710 [Vibrio parahaemolyticus]|nr:hypothetical protein [Vibrio parahaemolyticus]
MLSSDNNLIVHTTTDVYLGIGTNQRLERTKLEKAQKFRIILVVLVVLVKLEILVILENEPFLVELH